MSVPGANPDGTVSWRALLVETATRLETAGFAGPDAQREARFLVAEAIGCDDNELVAHLEDLATKRGVASLDGAVSRRSTGEPLAYVLGHWPFRTLDLMVDRRVLIPRPETEQVAGWALDELARLDREGPTVADLGCGSGAIGLAVAVEHPGSEVWMGDLSADAVAVARANLAGLGRRGANVRVGQGDWFGALPAQSEGSFDLIVANPPYVAPGDQIDRAVAEWEPPMALWADDPAGLGHLQTLVQGAPRWLQPHGVLVLEAQPNQATALIDLASARFEQSDIMVDYAGRARALVARQPR